MTGAPPRETVITLTGREDIECRKSPVSKVSWEREVCKCLSTSAPRSVVVKMSRRAATRDFLYSTPKVELASAPHCNHDHGHDTATRGGRLSACKPWRAIECSTTKASSGPSTRQRKKTPSCVNKFVAILSGRHQRALQSGEM